MSRALQMKRIEISKRHGFRLLGWIDREVLFDAGKINFAIAPDGCLRKVKRNPCTLNLYPAFVQAHAGFEQVVEKIYWGNMLWERFQDN